MGGPGEATPKRQGGLRILFILTAVAMKVKPSKSLLALSKGVLSVVSKDKWFVGRKPSTSEIIAKSANQIMSSEMPEIPRRYKILYKILEG